MTKTQLLEHSQGSGLDHERRPLSGVPQVRESGAFSCVVGCIGRASIHENDPKPELLLTTVCIDRGFRSGRGLPDNLNTVTANAVA